MKKLEYIETETHKDTAILWLKRPEKGNALNPGLIREFIACMETWNADPAIRFIIIRGKGKHFCAGADLNWMAASARLSQEENLEESLELAAFFESVYYSDKICISLIQGACYGGGIGLAAVCDFVFADPSARFSFGEIRLGLVPATIAPFVANRTGTTRAKQLMLTGEAISAGEAHKAGLVDELVSTEEDRITALLQKVREGSPRAQKDIKNLLNRLTHQPYSEKIRDITAGLIASARVSDDGKEGIKAFLEKRKPKWIRE